MWGLKWRSVKWRLNLNIDCQCQYWAWKMFEIAQIPNCFCATEEGNKKAECEMWSKLENKTLPLQNQGHANCTTNPDCTGFSCKGIYQVRHSKCKVSLGYLPTIRISNQVIFLRRGIIYNLKLNNSDLILFKKFLPAWRTSIVVGIILSKGSSLTDS